MKRRTVSLCMIARDEEATIGLAIKSAMALVDEIVVVDTGSRDNTRIIAEGYGARVVDFPWRDDFAAARNAALAEAGCEWILVLDADERLQPVRPVELQRLLRADKVAGYRLQVCHPHGSPQNEPCERVRLFRNLAVVRYRYPIHEQVTPALEAWAAGEEYTIRDADLTILSEGRDTPQDLERRDRNLRILRRAIAADPDEPYFEYRMACEILVTLDDEVLPVAGLGSVLENLDRSWAKVLSLPEADRSRLAYGADLVTRITACHLASGLPGRARQFALQGRELYGDEAQLLLQSVAAGTRYLQEHAGELVPAETGRLLERTRHDIDTLRTGPPDRPGSPVVDRVCTLYPLRYLGELALLEGRVAEAAELFERALTIDSSYSFAWLGLAECARFAGDRKRALKLYLRTVTENEWNHRAWLRGSGLLEELDFRDNAASWRRKVATLFPEHPDCRAPVAATGESHLAPVGVR